MPLDYQAEDRLRRIALWSARFGFGPAARPRRSRRPLPLAAWMLGLGLIAIGFVAFLYWIQQSELILVLGQQDLVDKVAIAEARDDILRNTLTAIAGFAVAAALLLHFRKQRHEEYHAAQQRIADLRIQAVGQLGDESPSVRIGGLHNLERLGESHPKLRQIVLDEICSYLRLDHRMDASREDAAPNSVQIEVLGHEAEVRLIAQEILQRHLRFATREQRRRYWSHERLDLKNARLVDLDFRGCLIKEADFGGAQFRGNGASFGDAQFSGVAVFRGVEFSGIAVFWGVQFSGDAVFVDAQFSGDAYFKEAQFMDNADFFGVHFGGIASFPAAQFGGIAYFQDALFGETVYFPGAQFGETVLFGDAQFSGGTNFQATELLVRGDQQDLPPGWTYADRAESDGTWRLVPVDDLGFRRAWAESIG
jgi:uncharacterized protein YjbI with pentapeptide repeats